MTRILITGGAGYVGSHCAKALADSGYDCIIFDNLSSGHREFVQSGEFINGDIRNAAALDAILSAGRVDAVLHFAALASVAESVAEPGAYYDVNVHGSNVLLNAMIRAGVKRIVFSSSCSIYGEPREVPITESSPRMPVNPYGMTKLVCERMMDDFDAPHGLKSVRLRYFNAAGADSAAGLGEDRAVETHLIPLALDALLGRWSFLSLYGTDYNTPDGTAIRDYIHVSDLAVAHVKALEHLLNGGATTALNLGTGKGASVRQVLESIRRICGSEVPVRIEGRRPGDPPVLIADATKAREMLNWAPARSNLDRIVADAWRWRTNRFA